MRTSARILMQPLLFVSFAALSVTNATGTGRPADIQVQVDYNFIADAPNHWESSGAFADQGTIHHDHSETFSPGNGEVATVTDSPEGANGTFTWTFKKAFKPIPGSDGQYRTSGGWRMLGGTGQYEGISGQGNLTGTVNLVTGELHDTFTGKVSFPK